MATDKTRRDTVLAVIRLGDRLAWEINRLLNEEKLTHPQYNVLRILRGNKGEPLSCGVLSQRLLTPVPDLTRVLDRLENRGLVERQRGTDDRRVVRVSITTEGLALLQRLDPRIDDLHGGQLNGLTERQVEDLRRLAGRAIGEEDPK